MQAGDQVQVKRSASHVFDSFRGETATVLELRTIGGRRWAHLDFEELGRSTWLPIDRLELAPVSGNVCNEARR